MKKIGLLVVLLLPFFLSENVFSAENNTHFGLLKN